MDEFDALRSFASDNNAPVHPKVMDALHHVNTGDYISYGDDPFTVSALRRFQEVFGPDSETYFVFNGTGANVLSLALLGRPYEAVVCTDMAHIHLDECGAPERFAGCKLLPRPSQDGKLTPARIVETLHSLGVEHHVQPRIVSVTQSTETGTVYTLEELRAITALARSQGLKVHMDGARAANAAAALGCSLKEMTAETGIDALSFGGTKNGMMFGEAVVLFGLKPGAEFKYIRKQGMQLASKMRYIAAQFEALLEGDLWLQNAKQANAMAHLLAQGASQIPGIEITRPVQSNGVFVLLPEAAAARMMERNFFYCMNEETKEYRWMTSYATDASDVQAFLSALREAMDGTAKPS